VATRYFVRAQLNLSGFHTPTSLLTRECKEPAHLQAQHGVVPGGRIELPTPAFSGPRSTGELPRHRHKRRFYEAHAQESNGPLNRVKGAARHGGRNSGSRLARFSNGSMPIPPSTRGPKGPCSCGQRARYVDRRSKRFQSTWRELKLERVLSCPHTNGVSRLGILPWARPPFAKLCKLSASRCFKGPILEKLTIIGFE
jgi:hypothetical protein